MSAADKPIRILTNDDGWILSNYGPPIRIDELRDKMIAPHANTPFDTFTIENLAGDLLPKRTNQQWIASGYNRLLQTTQEGGGQAKEYLAKL